MAWPGSTSGDITIDIAEMLAGVDFIFTNLVVGVLDPSTISVDTDGSFNVSVIRWRFGTTVVDEDYLVLDGAFHGYRTGEIIVTLEVVVNGVPHSRLIPVLVTLETPVPQPTP